MSTFVDSSVWFAAAAKNDRNNKLAKSILTSVRSPITDHVLSETWLLLKGSFGERAADVFWDRLRAAGIQPEPSKEADLEFAWQIGKHFPSLSLVDRVSFAFMELRGITKFAKLRDDDVREYRYGPRQDRTFRIIAKGHSTIFDLLSRAALYRKAAGRTLCQRKACQSAGRPSPTRSVIVRSR